MARATKPRPRKETRRAPASSNSEKPVHRFSLIFSGPGELTDEVENALFEAGCDDALLGIQDGEIFLDFDRRAPSFRVALLSAIFSVEKAGVGLELIRIETP